MYEKVPYEYEKQVNVSMTQIIGSIYPATIGPMTFYITLLF